MDEKGAQAAAASGIVGDMADFFQSAYDGMEFYANKPFLFMIFEADHFIPVITGVIKKM